PTVERIRAHLGTGSPNTVLRWLDTWWEGLGARLRRKGPGFDLPHAPEPVADLAGQLWATALEHAKVVAAGALARERDLLQTDRSVLDADRQDMEREAAAWRARATVALQVCELAVGRGEELERFVGSLERHLEETKTLQDAV